MDDKSAPSRVRLQKIRACLPRLAHRTFHSFCSILHVTNKLKMDVCGNCLNDFDSMDHMNLCGFESAISEDRRQVIPLQCWQDVSLADIWIPSHLVPSRRQPSNSRVTKGGDFHTLEKRDSRKQFESFSLYSEEEILVSDSEEEIYKEIIKGSENLSENAFGICSSGDANSSNIFITSGINDWSNQQYKNKAYEHQEMRKKTLNMKTTPVYTNLCNSRSAERKYLEVMSSYETSDIQTEQHEGLSTFCFRNLEEIKSNKKKKKKKLPKQQTCDISRDNYKVANLQTVCCNNFFHELKLQKEKESKSMVCKLIIENIPKEADEDDIIVVLSGYGEIKNFSLETFGEFLKAYVELNLIYDVDWIIECLNGAKLFGASSKELKCYKQE